MGVAAINASGQRAIQPRQSIPIAPSALDEEQLLITELILKPLGHLLRMLIDRGLVRLEWQQLLLPLTRALIPLSQSACRRY
jgi:hypothetical protein